MITTLIIDIPPERFRPMFKENMASARASLAVVFLSINQSPHICKIKSSKISNVLRNSQTEINDFPKNTTKGGNNPYEIENLNK